MHSKPAETPTHGPVIVQRWRRYGHDRAYVTQNDIQLGYRDLKTGEIVPAYGADVRVIAQATEGLLARTQAAQYQPRHSAASPAAAPSVLIPGAAPAAPEDHPVLMPDRPVLMPDRDLADNRPGQAAREQAMQLRAEAPVRTFLARVIGAKTDERNWRIGADAEQEVARRLEGLGPEWRMLNAVPVGDRGSDIDHVVIGPGGVFTINTKHHPGAGVWVRGDTVKVDGASQPYIRNSRHEAARAARLLSAASGFDVAVDAIIAVMGAKAPLVIKQQPTDVTVTTRRDVVAFLRQRPSVLGRPSIDRIYDVARHLSTWQPKSVRREAFPFSI